MGHFGISEAKIDEHRSRSAREFRLEAECVLQSLLVRR